MPRFLLPVLVLAIAFWVVFLIILNYSSPFDVNPSAYRSLPIVYFLGALFLAVAFTGALIFYFLVNIIGRPWDKRRVLRQGLRWGFLAGLWVIGFLLLKLSKTYHLLNLILLTAVLAAVEIVFREQT